MANATDPVGEAPAVSTRTDTRIDDAMSAAHDCPFGKPTHRFLILAEPRSGSTLLVEALRNSGVAGVPFEYLNPRYVERWAARMGIEGEPPMRLWPCSYWLVRELPDSRRMPPYALVIFATGAPAMAALNRLVCVMMYAV